MQLDATPLEAASGSAAPAPSRFAHVRSHGKTAAGHNRSTTNLNVAGKALPRVGAATTPNMFGAQLQQAERWAVGSQARLSLAAGNRPSVALGHEMVTAATRRVVLPVAGSWSNHGQDRVRYRPTVPTPRPATSPFTAVSPFWANAASRYGLVGPAHRVRFRPFGSRWGGSFDRRDSGAGTPDQGQHGCTC